MFTEILKKNLQCTNFIDKFNQRDIIIFSECWTNENSILDITGYKSIVKNRPKVKRCMYILKRKYFSSSFHRSNVKRCNYLMSALSMKLTVIYMWDQINLLLLQSYWEQLFWVKLPSHYNVHCNMQTKFLTAPRWNGLPFSDQEGSDQNTAGSKHGAAAGHLPATPGGRWDTLVWCYSSIRG